MHPSPDWVEDPDADDDESVQGPFNETFESECYGDELDKIGESSD